MDEVAFVESLFAPEMRSSLTVSNLFPSSCNRRKTRMGDQRSTSFVPPPPNSLLGGGITLVQGPTPFQAPLVDDPPLFVRLHDDEMFNQMLTDHDFAEFQHPGPSRTHPFKKELMPVNSIPNSLLLEPLELPRGKDDDDDVEHCLKDKIRHDTTMSFPSSFRTRGGAARSGGFPGTNGYTLDGPVMPLLSHVPVHFSAGDYAALPSHSWIQEADEEGEDAASLQHLYTMKHMMHLAGMPLMPQQPSPGAVDMFNTVATSAQVSAAPELWISTSRNSVLEVSMAGERKLMKQAVGGSKTPVDCPPVSFTISPPASLTDKALKDLIVSTDFGTPTVSRQKRARAFKSQDDLDHSRAKTARTTSASCVGQPSNPSKATGRSTKGKKCVELGCTRRAQSNSRCKAHGGGARCQYAGSGGCTRSSQGGGFCRAHGGGKRCEFPGCTRGQQRKGRCYVHGGIRKCQYGTCEKKDRGNGFCIAHGGGKRCEHPNCSRAVRRGLQCQIHETQPTSEKERGEVVSL